MKLANVVLLYGTRLRARLGQELLALVGIAVGVSLLFAALVANASLTSSFDRTLDGVIGDARWQLTARGAVGADMSETYAAAARATPGVAAAAPVLETRAEVHGRNRQRSIMLIGVTAEFAKANGRSTERLSVDYLAGQQVIGLPAPLARDLGLALGQEVALTIDGRRVRGRIGALLERDQIGEVVDAPLGIAPLAYLQQLSGNEGKITRIFVVPRPNANPAEVAGRLEALAGERLGLQPARFEADLFRQASEPTSQSTAMFSVFSALVGFLFAFSAVLLTVPDRRRLIADLNLEGYAPRTIAKVILFDALVLGVIGSALGILVGDQVARRLFAEAPSFLGLAFTFGSQRIVTAQAVVIAAIGGIVASCVAVFGPTASAILGIGRSRDAPSRARRRAAVASVEWLLVIGVACLLAGAAIVIAAPRSATVGILGLALVTVSMLLLLPRVLRLAVTGLSRATFGMRTVVPFLASVDLRDRTVRVRALAVAATGAVAVFGSVALQGAHADLQRGLDRTSRDQVSIGDLWAMAPGDANLLATIPFAPAAPVRAPPGIRDVAEFRGSFLDVGDRRVWVIGTPASAHRPIPRNQTLEGDDELVNRRIHEGGWAVVSAGVGADLGLEVGERFTLPSPNPIVLRVAALTTNMGWPPGAIVINADDYATAWGSDDLSAITATLAPGTPPAEGRRALAAALGPESGLVVKTAAEREELLRAGSRQGLERLTQIAALVLVAAMIAMAAAMAGLIWQRRPFYAAVKIEGYGTRAIWQSLLLESALLIGVGCAMGAAFGLLGQGLLSRALTNVTGFPVAYALAAAPAILSCLAVIIVSVAIVAVFGYHTARVSVTSRAPE